MKRLVGECPFMAAINVSTVYVPSSTIIRCSSLLVESNFKITVSERGCYGVERIRYFCVCDFDGFTSVIFSGMVKEKVSVLL
jgi:hypothetical protein